MVTSAWKTKHGFEVRDIAKNLFTLRFFSEQDRDNALKLGPWNFNHNLIILRELAPDENPKEVVLAHTLFWVRVYDLTMNLRSEQMAKKLGDFLGTFEAWDSKEEQRLGNSLRLRVWLDVTKPLKRGTVIPKSGKPPLRILFKYERLADFCFGCGALDHVLRYCDDKEDTWQEEDEANLPYGPWVRASPLKPTNTTVMRQEGRISLAKKNLFTEAGNSSTVPGSTHPKEKDSGIMQEPTKGSEEVNNETSGDEGTALNSTGKDPKQGTTPLKNPTPILNVELGLVESLGNFSLHNEQASLQPPKLINSPIITTNQGETTITVSPHDPNKTQKLRKEQQDNAPDPQESDVVPKTPPEPIVARNMKLWKRKARDCPEEKHNTHVSQGDLKRKDCVEDETSLMDTDPAPAPQNNDYHRWRLPSSPAGPNENLKLELPRAWDPGGNCQAGGLALYWNSGLDLSILSHSLNHINFQFPLHHVNKTAIGTGFYGHPEKQQKWRSWELLRSLKPTNHLPWLCFRDFNEILCQDEKKGGLAWDCNQSMAFHQVITECNLQDLGFSHPIYTWSNNRPLPHTIEERIDRALANSNWQQSWKSIQVTHIPRFDSDHSPITISCSLKQKKKRKRVRLYRFEEMWLKDADCKEVIATSWRHTRGGADRRLTATGANLDAWGEARFGNPTRKVNKLKDKLKSLHEQDQTEAVILETKKTESELHEFLQHEEIFWCQRSRASWLAHEDKNTSFFHKKASQRKSKNTIESIEDDRGNRFVEDEDIAEVINAYFGNLFTTSTPPSLDTDPASLVQGRITESHKLILNSPYISLEVEEALKCMHPTKAPGSDGTRTLFYKKFWDIVGEDVTDLVLQILNGQKSPKDISHTLIVLIPKIKKPTHTSHYRPISLCNTLFKLVTKVIANRLKLILPDIVSENQSAFVPNRLITDNALVAFECFHHMKSNRSRSGNIALKLDMTKAYDRVEWSFLERTLTHFGFPPQWIKVVMGCVNTVTFSVLINGSPDKCFAPGRGLRQGDPLSPYLFILCAEVLSAMFQHAIASKTLSGIRITPRAPVISHLFFADDSIIFAKASTQEAATILHILHSYEAASGQKINLDKSEISWSRGVLKTRVDELKLLLQMKAVASHPRYLGLPTLVGRSKTQVFSFARDRGWKKLKGWKERTLSRAGREVLVKSVAQAIPTYIMGCFALPNSLCNHIESLISRFYWGGDVDKRKLHWLSWGKITKRKAKGGLGFRSIKEFNQALLAKQWWRLRTNPNCLLARILKARYHPSSELANAQIGYHPSYTWRSILGAKSVIDNGSAWRIGNGRSVRIWKDKWLPHMLTPRTGIGINTSDMLPVWVSELINNETHTWDTRKIAEFFTQPEAEMILKIPLPSQPRDDQLMWTHTKQGIYSVKSGHHSILSSNDEASTSNPTTSSIWSNIWEVDIQPRCKEFIWRAAQNALPVKANLIRRGIHTDPICPMCGDDRESTCHAILTCPEVRAIWFSSPLGLHINLTEGMSFKEWLEHLLSHLPNTGQQWLFSVAWAIWKRRNAWLFEQKRVATDKATEQVLIQASRMVTPEPEQNQSQSNQSPPIPPRWKPPGIGTIKGNFDASIRENRGTGLGLIFRDHAGKLLAAGTSFLQTEFEPVIGEAISLRRTITLAGELGFHNLELESDCLQLVQAWNRTTPHNNYLASVVQDCKSLSVSLNLSCLNHCNRLSNAVADYLAKLAFEHQDQIWVGFDPPGTSILIQQDTASCTRFEASTS
ncbi:uncharacterized protein LOC130736815 [Lotus japonicus]|uniref:uncharacterized protein LOC130736815 n=1 Tax=Lotus japonicus TaxID=34305 RepID=UPI002590B4F4|nr:uncharacterized protein LOC130736815 [Lotus japonicus]